MQIITTFNRARERKRDTDGEKKRERKKTTK